MSIEQRLSFLAAGGLVLAAAVADAQPPPTGRVFSEELEVRVVNVEVVVTDREGRRVEGLTARDFRLRVDGKEVPIEFFTEVRAGAAIGGAEQASGPRRIPSLNPGDGVGTSFLVFIDEYFAVARDRDRVLAQLREQLPLLGLEDRMAVVAFDGERLDMLTTWTRSLEALERAFKEAERRPALGLQRHSERRRDDLLLGESVLRATAADSDFRLDVDERQSVQRLTHQLERVVAAATSTLRGFASPPGRKIMLLLSGGWPYDPIEFVVNDLTRPISEPGIKGGDELLAPLSDTANLLGYTLYPVDVPGFQGTAVDTSALASELGSITSQSFVRETGLHHTLSYLAEETGGTALINQRRDEVFSEVVSDTRSYYWIGFTPTRKGDDQRHRVVVEVLRPGLEVRSRSGFIDFSRSREVNMAVESALFFGSPPSPHPLIVHLGRPEKAGRNRMLVPLAVAIPVDSVTFLPAGPERYAARLELRVAVLDEDGVALDEIPVIPLDIEVAAVPRPGTLLRYSTGLKMRRKPHDVVVALYDFPSGVILSTSVEVTPN